MSNEAKNCPQCGEALTSEAPGGLCPRCVMEMNLLGDTMERTPGGIPAVEDLAPHFPQLEIIDCLGRGGMGIVYKARQPQLDRFVALKILAPERVDDLRFAERFRREAVSLARLDHPNIVTVYDTGESGGYYYLLMEFVDGLNLREAIAGEKMPAREALAIVPPICAGLQYAHDNGVVHRDIKPENILLDKKGRVKIADFGVAKLVCGPEDAPAGGGADESAADPGLTMGGTLGTPQYMAPEQEAKSGAADHRADIYALGVVFYEMLTGERPKGDLVAPSKKVEVDVRIDEIVLRALEKEPAKRYQTAGEFRTVVETIAETRTRAQVPPPTPAPAPAPVAAPAEKKKSKVAVVVVGCLAMVLIFPALLGLLVALSYAGMEKKKLAAMREEERAQMEQVLAIERQREAAMAAQAAELGNALEGSFTGRVDGRDVEWHIIEFGGAYHWIENGSFPGRRMVIRGDSLVGGGHSDSLRLSLIPGSSGLLFERSGVVLTSGKKGVELRRVNYGIEALIAQKNSAGMIRWIDEVMSPFLGKLHERTKGTGKERTTASLLGIVSEFRAAAARGDWDAVGEIMRDKGVSPEDTAALRELLDAPAIKAEEETDSADANDSDAPKRVARAHMEAARALDVDRALALWNEDREASPQRRAQTLRNMQEIVKAYEQDLDRMTTFTEWYLEARYAVGRLAAPKGADQSRSLYIIVSQAKDGWGVVALDDIRADESLASKLDRLLDRGH